MLRLLCQFGIWSTVSMLAVAITATPWRDIMAGKGKKAAAAPAEGEVETNPGHSTTVQAGFVLKDGTVVKETAKVTYRPQHNGDKVIVTPEIYAGKILK